MNKIFRFIVKSIITILIFSFFGGCLRGFASGGSHASIKGMEAVVGAIVLFGTLYGVWTYKPPNNEDENDITLKKD